MKLSLGLRLVVGGVALLLAPGCTAALERNDTSDASPFSEGGLQCGNGRCGVHETCQTCPDDCGSCSASDSDAVGAMDGALEADSAPAADSQPIAADSSQAGADASGSSDAGGTTSPSGVSMPVGDIAGWHQIFTDDFTTDVALGSFPTAVKSKWSAYPHPWHDTSKNGTYWPEKVISVHDGVMDLYLHTDANGVHCVSAPYPLLPGATSRNGLSAGRYAIRFRSAAIKGYKTAWLLWPDSGVWPRDGEIDFPEGSLTGTISGFMHRQNGTSGSDQDAYSTSATYTSWHTAVIEWRPKSSDLKMYLDGKLIGHSTSRVPNTPMHWVIQTETHVSSTPPPSSAAGHVKIDWVAVYVPKP